MRNTLHYTRPVVDYSINNGRRINDGGVKALGVVGFAAWESDSTRHSRWKLRLDRFKSPNARLKSLASRHWGQTRRIAVSRVDILISVAWRARRQPDCSQAPANKTKRKGGSERKEKEPENTREKNEKRGAKRETASKERDKTIESIVDDQ